MTSDRANGTTRPSGFSPEEPVEAATSESTPIPENTDSNPSEPKMGKLVVFPSSFKTKIEVGVTEAVSTEKSTPRDSRKTRKRRGTLKRLLKRRAGKRDLESFLRDRFKQMILSEFLDKNQAAETLDPTALPELPIESKERIVTPRRTSSLKPSLTKSAFSNSKGLKHRATMQRDTVRKTEKPAANGEPKGPTTEAKKPAKRAVKRIAKR